ncbi:uncharacterized protein LOC114309791 isoform X3 [Camellia sinensis]|uniref:uncharacterized protein LOC114309791 isoform X3 n=1 Tax=Camellia sinensis TaxID=4442 RepID=UPI00103582A8|nr:uncharacterized protein LOC114309791 isoform X3 [Camellia sinensis]
MGFHCLPRELHVVGKGDHMLMNEYYLLCLWTLFLIGGSEANIKLLRRVSHRLHNPYVARELTKLDILDVAPIHLLLLGTDSSDVCIEEIKEANGLIGDTIYAGKQRKRGDPCPITWKRFKMILIKLCEIFYWIGWLRLQRNTNLSRTPFISLYPTLTDSYLIMLIFTRTSQENCNFKCVTALSSPSQIPVSYFKPIYE